MMQPEAHEQISSRLAGSTALRTGAGGAIGAGVAALGLLLGAGEGRFIAALAAFAAIAWLASKAPRHPLAGAAAALFDRAGALLLVVLCGAGLGLALAGRADANVLPALWLPLMLILLAGLGGAGAGASSQLRPEGRRLWAGLALALLAGSLAGAVLGQYFTWATAKFYLWGAAMGAGLLFGVSRLARPGATSAPRGESALVFLTMVLILFNSALPEAWSDVGALNPYTYQARSFLQGRLDIDFNSANDVALFADKIYLPFPPLPAVLLLPFVWVSGGSPPTAPLTLITSVLGAFSAMILWGILGRMQVSARLRPWLILAFVFGTGYWYVVKSSQGAAPYLAHVVAVPCLLLALREALGRRRGWLAGLFVGLAFLSRPFTIFAVFVVAALLLQRAGRARSPEARWNLVFFCAALAACVGLQMAFNYLRFGNPLDNGYTYQVARDMDAVRRTEFGLFSPAYIPVNLYYTFLHGFHIEFEGPLLLQPARMDPFGTSLTFASPFLLLALLARGNRPLVWGGWLSAGCMLLGHLSWANNGALQINTQRFMLDYLPILILLVALGAERVRHGWLAGLALYAAGLNVIALIIVPWLARELP